MLREGWERFADSHRLAEFLPDAEGVVERRHSPVAGLLIVVVALVFGGVLAWSALTEVEQVVRAEGQIEPADRVKVINHPDGGRIATVDVVEGQRVTAGAPLLSFDAEQVHARLAELTARWQIRSIETARLSAEVKGGDMVVDPELAGTRPDLVAEQQALLLSRREAHQSRVEALAQNVEQREKDLQGAEAEFHRLRASHALLKEQLDAVKGLADKGLYPRLRVVALERQLSDLSGDIHKAQAGREAAQAAIAEGGSRHAALEREQRASVLAELTAARTERDQLIEAHRRQAATLRDLVVRAPVDGIVQDIAASPGQSVGSNQPLMKLVPTGSGLVVEARVQNRDIGYVRVGQPVTVKVHAYDFLRHGTLAGQIEQIDADAVVNPQTGALTYGILVRTAGDALVRDGVMVQVVPGMAVDVDLLVGERTILSYLTDRIFHLGEAAFREG
ncbi:MAG TPA: HlyD family type I secretion periplasmic adaptor subunit [Geminicoccaceae bacterium]|nr:HlyD family type I secretion periplasmic adaptor subunit [Geminicoccaceae bacterium]